VEAPASGSKNIVKRGFAWCRASGSEKVCRASGSHLAVGRNRADAGFFSE
jgi:hypothetical protein